ncbi:alpha-1,4-glucan branching enzyme [Aspergillus nanangensis]|uniref:Alpha-1,4-glucan branching enzyme n=1 Tax=Aspergillus nanangensis TaxID=2582783 RepID=A0AAD4CMU0_ASPNN|nr:alpha-1,4-glucan branching enzyme [Aspergillus nanangensis]
MGAPNPDPMGADVEPATSNTASYPNEKAGLGSKIDRDLNDERYQPTKRGLRSRHAQMIALGGSIGTGLFVGSGQALAVGGPASLFMSYCFVACVVYGVVTALAEVAAYLPTHGGTMGFYGYRYASRSFGFAMGYLYWYSMGILVPYEIVAGAVVIDYWQTDLNVAIWISILLVVIVALNFLPVKFYGETEFWFASIKVITLFGLLIVSFILFWGGGPKRQRLGFHYWKNPSAFNTYDPYTGGAGRFAGLLKCLMRSAFGFIFSPELLITTGGEMENPRRNLPTAAKRYIYRLIFFYVLGSLSISVICPSDHARLTDGGAGAGSSPFVVGIQHAGIPVLHHIINAAILTSAWSSGNSYLYMSSRNLYSLAMAGNAPSFLKTTNRWGVPYVAVASSALFAPLAYLTVGTDSSIVFNWFVDFTNTSGFMSWMCCMIVYWRFRKAVATQGIELPYVARIQPYGSYFAFFGATILTLGNGFDVFFPSQWTVGNFFAAYFGIPAFFAFYFGHRIVFRRDPWAWHPAEVDMHSGLDEISAAELPPRVRDTWWKKAMAVIE